MIATSQRPMKAPWARLAITWLGLAVAYFVLAQLSFKTASLHHVVASVWPPAGVALSALLLLGVRCWPGVFLGVLLTNAVEGLPWTAASIIAMGNSLAAIAGASVLQRLGFERTLHRVQDPLLLLAFGAVLPPIIAATAGSGALYWIAGVPVSNIPEIWTTWWSGDALGVMLAVPLIGTWAERRLPAFDWRRALEAALLGGCLVALSIVLMKIAQHGLEYAVLPLVCWAAIRGGARGASVATLILAVIAMWYAADGTGSFSVSGHHGLLQLQVFLAVLASTSLVMGALSAAQLRAAGALRVNEQRFRRIFEHSAVGIAVVHMDGCITEANPAFRTMMGYSNAELANCHLADVTHPEDMAAEQGLLDQILAGKRTTYRLVKRYLRKDGSVFWGRLTATHVPEGIDGLESAAVGIIEDISEQRAAEEALKTDAAERQKSGEQLQRTMQTLQTLIDASPLAIMTLDSSGKVRSWNHAAEQMFGWPANEAIGLTVPFVPPEGMENFRESLQRVFRGEALTGLQVERRHRDGRRLDLRVCAAPTRDSSGAIDGVIALIEDVTERKNLGEQLR